MVERGTPSQERLLLPDNLSSEVAVFIVALAQRSEISPRDIVSKDGRLTPKGIEMYTQKFQKNLGPILAKVRQDPIFEQKFREWIRNLPPDYIQGTISIGIKPEQLEELREFFNANGANLTIGELGFLKLQLSI